MKKSPIPYTVWLILLLSFGLSPTATLYAQDSPSPFHFGVDLSYVNEMEDCGAVYREDGIPRDPFELFTEHGATLVRARLWHTPTWTDYSTRADVKRTFTRARKAGMSTLLDIHYSDLWADPGRQEIPAAWLDFDEDELVDAVYQYTLDIFTELASEDIVPDMVQIGNETNSGIMKQVGPQDWQRDARLFNAGIRAVRDFSAANNHPVKILLHVAQPENTTWWFTQAEAAGITDFDIIGISFYPQWSTFSIGDMGAQVTALRQRFGKEVMILETAYAWTRDAVAESADNVLDQGLRGYPFSPEGQRRFMHDVTQALISNGAMGVVYWEPAWVSTDCLTRWGQGSHWENATFFDFQNGNEVLPGINFMNDAYLYPEILADGVIEIAYGDPFMIDGTGDLISNAAALDLSALYLRSTTETLFVALTTEGAVLSHEGSYLLYIDTTHDAQGATIDVGRRPILVADPFKPEFRLDIGIQDEGGTSRGTYSLNAWIEGEWETITFTGGAALASGAPSVIELHIPLALLNHPTHVHLALVSTDRGRARGASDVLGADLITEETSANLNLDQFFGFELSPAG